jgi:hypothetical protein
MHKVLGSIPSIGEGERRPGMVDHTCNPSIEEVETVGSRVWGQPGLHSETLSQKERKKEQDKLRNWKERDNIDMHLLVFAIKCCITMTTSWWHTTMGVYFWLMQISWDRSDSGCWTLGMVLLHAFWSPGRKSSVHWTCLSHDNGTSTRAQAQLHMFSLPRPHLPTSSDPTPTHCTAQSC